MASLRPDLQWTHSDPQVILRDCNERGEYEANNMDRHNSRLRDFTVKESFLTHQLLTELLSAHPTFREEVLKRAAEALQRSQKKPESCL